jgi:elongation factor G
MKEPKYRRVTITEAAEGEGKFIRHSAARSQYGHVVVRLEPNARGKGIEIISEVRGGAVPEEYIKPVTDAVREALHGGVVPGCRVVDVVVRVVGGSSHQMDSSEIAFKMAAIFALKDALKGTDPVVIE